MDKHERFVIAMILIIFLSLSIAVIKTAYGIQQDIQKVIKEEKERESRHLPTECEQYYCDGTDQWIECMQVGYVNGD